MTKQRAGQKYFQRAGFKLSFPGLAFQFTYPFLYVAQGLFKVRSLLLKHFYLPGGRYSRNRRKGRWRGQPCPGSSVPGATPAGSPPGKEAAASTTAPKTPGAASRTGPITPTCCRIEALRYRITCAVTHGPASHGTHAPRTCSITPRHL